jgi:DNA-binding NarL/FixJ family response regulator
MTTRATNMRLRMIGPPAHTPVLLVSGQLSERNIREAVEAGVDGFVAKPFVEAPLARGVSRLLVGSLGAPHGSDRGVSHTQSLFGSSGTGHGP